MHLFEILCYLTPGAATVALGGQELIAYKARKNTANLLRTAQDFGEIVINNTYAETLQIAQDALFFYWLNEPRTKFVPFIFVDDKTYKSNMKIEIKTRTKIALINYNLRKQMPVADNDRREILNSDTGLKKQVARILSQSATR